MNMMKTEKITGKMTAYKICLIAFAICINANFPFFSYSHPVIS